MLDIFSGIVGQERAVGNLRKNIRLGRQNHAYLFAGPAGSGRLKTAIALAQSLLCEDNGCGICNSCIRAGKLIHPDLHVIEAAGDEILIDQIREVISESQMVPVEGRSKVFIIPEAERLTVISANAFLKTIEEPERGNAFVLIAPDEGAVLPTIASRCQVLRFSRLKTADVKDVLNMGEIAVAPSEIETIASENGWALDRIAAVLEDPEYRSKRNAILEFLALGTESISMLLDFSGQLRKYAATRTSAIKATNKRELEGYLKINEDKRGSVGLRRDMEQRHNRAEKAARLNDLKQSLAIIMGWYRDLLAIKCEARETVFNADFMEQLRAAAGSIRITEVIAAIEAINRAEEVLRYNVSDLLIIDNLAIVLGGINAGSSRRIF